MRYARFKPKIRECIYIRVSILRKKMFFDTRAKKRHPREKDTRAKKKTPAQKDPGQLPDLFIFSFR